MRRRYSLTLFLRGAAEAIGRSRRGGTATRNLRLNSSSVVSAPISSARSTNRRDCSLSGFGFFGIDRLAVSEPLADDTTDQPVGALLIVDAQGGSVAVAEIVFGKVAVKVGFAD